MRHCCAALALNGYLAAGIRTDHEATTAAEAREKLAKGMAILIREGSVSKDLEALAEMLDENTSSFVALCTDDRNPLDIAEEGHLDLLHPPADRHGPAAASRLPRRQPLGRPHLRPARIAASSRPAGAPISRCSTDLEDCQVAEVITAGRLVAPELFDARQPVRAGGPRLDEGQPVTPDDFIVPPESAPQRDAGDRGQARADPDLPRKRGAGSRARRARCRTSTPT